MENIPRRNVLKEDFNWEVPIETVPLPSKGILYSEESGIKNKETINIKAMTALEEDILISQAYIKEGIVIEKLIESCVTDIKLDPFDLITGDKNALMVSIRITGYGPEYPVASKCRKCGHQNDVQIDLASLGIKRLNINPVQEGTNLFEYKLPVSRKTVFFRFPDGHSEKESEMIKRKYKSLGIEKNNTVTDYLERVIVSIDGIEDKNKITHFIKNMPALDSKKLRKFITESEPGIDMTWEYNCSSCSHDNQIAIPITSEFFWPNT